MTTRLVCEGFTAGPVPAHRPNSAQPITVSARYQSPHGPQSSSEQLELICKTSLRDTVSPACSGLRSLACCPSHSAFLRRPSHMTQTVSDGFMCLSALIRRTTLTARNLLPHNGSVSKDHNGLLQTLQSVQTAQGSLKPCFRYLMFIFL